MIRSQTDLLKAIERLPDSITFQRRSYKKPWRDWLLSKTRDRSAKSIYNTIHLPEWLIWLAAASGADQKLIESAIKTIDHTKRRETQAATVRRVLPWSLMAQQLETPNADRAFSIDDIASDFDAIYRSKEETTKRTLIEARLGQGQFRTNVAKRWNNQCAVTGCTIIEMLRASHIKPWSKCSHSDRLNPANGILLAAHLDALFDCGLVSFADDGMMLVADEIAAELRPFRLPDRLRCEPKKEEKRFLAYHRRHVFAS
jgi:predicted restriction endonuclease